MIVGIFPLGIGMLFRAWKIAARKDYRYMADWRGRLIEDGMRWAYPVMRINGAGCVGLLLAGILVRLAGLPFALWSGATALNIDPARFIREFVRAEPVEAQPPFGSLRTGFDRLRANGTHVYFVPDQYLERLLCLAACRAARQACPNVGLRAVMAWQLEKHDFFKRCALR